MKIFTIQLISKLLILAVCLSFFFINIINFINLINLYPTRNEEVAINSFYKNKLEFKSEEDIINFQNITVKEIRQAFNGNNCIDIKKIFLTKKGLCFDRSLIMQKVFLLKGIKIRPVYIYSNPQGKTTFFDILKTDLRSHSVFEIYFFDHWYVIETNYEMKKLISLEEYSHNFKLYNSNRYLRYLNNRHGRFISPSYIPDIYWSFF